MPQSKKLVELGRVVHITTGPAAGNVGAIVDIIDAKRLLVDSPRMTRQEIKLKDVFLTRIMLDITDVPSHKDLVEMWNRKMIDTRYNMTVHAKHLEKMKRRAACTDFEYFKVRTVSRQANKIKANCLKNLNANHPRAMAKMERKRRVDMGVALGYRTVKKLTPEEKAVKDARQKILHANRVTKSKEYFKAKKEKRAKNAEVRKARLARKKAAGKLKERKPVPKESRKRKINKTPSEPQVTTLKAFRKQRDADRKSAAAFRKEHSKALQENRAAIKAAVKAGTKPPHKLRVKKILPKSSTLKKSVLKLKERKAAAASAE